MGVFPNADAFLAGLKAEPEKLKACFRTQLVAICRAVHQGVTGRTPVWSGSALRNYVWTANQPYSGVKGDPGGVEKGPTNTMPLGPEPRRASAKAEADASLAGLDFTDPYRVFWLTNNDPDIRGLEYGLLPPKPLRQRSPAGMFRVTLASVVTLLRAGAI